MGPELGATLLGLSTFLNTPPLYSGGRQDVLCVCVVVGGVTRDDMSTLRTLVRESLSLSTGMLPMGRL